MMHTAQSYLRENKNKRKTRIALGALGIIVAVAVLVVLISPGLADEPESICGLAEHTHTGECYRVLVCEAGDDHVHDEGCYSEPELICTMPEGHTHDSTCWGEPLICGLDEAEAHEHSAACFEDVLVCGEEHEHDGSCYSMVRICGIDAHPGHTHDASCYGEPELICGIEENHLHNETCYGEPALICTETGHIHDEGCYTLSSEPQCGLFEHVHDESCFPGESELTGEPEEDELEFEDCPYCLEGILHGHANATILAEEPSPFMGLMGAAAPIVPANTWDLRNFATGVTIKDKNGANVTNGQFYLGDTYTFDISFTERAGPNGQFAYDAPLIGTKVGSTFGDLSGGCLVYYLPDELVVKTQMDGYILLPNNTRVGEYTVYMDGHIEVRFGNYNNIGGDSVPPTRNFIDMYTDTTFKMEIKAEFTETKASTKIDFGANASISIKVDYPPASLQVAKSATTFNSTDETVEFSIKITAIGGEVTDVVLTDALNFNIQSNFKIKKDDIDSSYYSIPFSSISGGGHFEYQLNGTGAWTQVSPVVWSSDGQSLVFDFGGSMVLEKDEYITLRYKLSLKDIFDYFGGQDWIQRFNYNLTLTNSAKATGKDWGKDVSGSATTNTPMTRSFVSKSGSYKSALNQIQWTVTVGDLKTMLNDWTITDTWTNSGAITQELDGDVTITFYNQSGTAITGAGLPITGHYSTVFTTTSGTGFTYDIPTTPTDIYKVVIVYNTIHSVSEDFADAPGTYSNTASITINGSTNSKTASVTVSTPVTPPDPGMPPDLSGITGTKDSEWVYDSNGKATAIRYTATITIPAGMQGTYFGIIDGLYITDSETSSATNYGGRGYDVTMQNSGGSAYGVVTNPANVKKIDIDPAVTPSLRYQASYYSAGNYRNMIEIFMDTKAVNIATAIPAWPFSDQRTVTLTYEVSLDAAVYSSSGSSWQHDGKTLRAMLELGWYLTNHIQIRGYGTSDYGTGAKNHQFLHAVTDYLPIRKSGSVDATDPTVFNYYVYLNWRPNFDTRASYMSITNDDRTGQYGYSLFEPGMPAIFEDTFDERLEYVPGSFFVQRRGNGANSINPSVTTLSFGPYDTSTDPRTDLVNVDGNRIWVDFSRDFVEFDDVAWTSPMTQPIKTTTPGDWYVGKYRYIVWYQLRLKEEYTEYTDEETPMPLYMDNTATVHGTSEKFNAKWSSKRTVTFTPQKAVTKRLFGEFITGIFRDNYAKAEIIINPLGQRLRPLDVDDAWFTAVDEMSDTLSLYLSSFMILYKERVGSGWSDWIPVDLSTVVPSGLWSINVISEHSFEIIIPDETPIMIYYGARINYGTADTPTPETTIENSISFYGYAASDKQTGFRVVGAGGDAWASDTELLLYKEDKDTRQRLAGADFTLYVALMDGVNSNLPYWSVAPSVMPEPIEIGSRPNPDSGPNVPVKFYPVADAVFEDGVYRFIDNENYVGASDPGYHVVGSYITPSHPFVFLIKENNPPEGYKIIDEYTFISLYQMSASDKILWESWLGHGIKLVADTVFIENQSINSATATIKGKKTLQGDPGVLDSISGTFAFELTQVNADLTPYSGAYPVRDLPAYKYVMVPVANLSDYEFKFDIAGLTEGYTYYFKIQEDVVSGAIGWYVVQGTRYVTVTVTSGVATVQVIGEDIGTDVAEFINRWLPPETPTKDVKIEGKKTIDGTAPPPETFTFKLTQVIDAGCVPVSGGIMDTTTCFGAGTFEFEINRLEEGTYYFLIEEVISDATGWEYDKTRYLIEIDVIDNSGSLEAVINYLASDADGDFEAGPPAFAALADEIVFINEYSPPKFLLTVDKSWDDLAGHNTRNSDITLLLTDNASPANEYVFEYNGDGTFSAVFHEFDFDSPATYRLFEICPAGYAPEGDYWVLFGAEPGKLGYYRYELQYDLTLELIGDIVEVVSCVYTGSESPEPSYADPPWEVINNVSNGGPRLPDVGGDGLKMLMFAGFTMMALAGVAFVAMRLIRTRLSFNTYAYSRRFVSRNGKRLIKKPERRGRYVKRE